MNWLVCFSAGFLVMSGALVGLLSDHPFIATAVGAIVVGTVAGALAPHVGALLSWVAWRLPPVPWRVRKARRLGLRPVAVRRLDLALGLVLLTGTAHAQMTLGIDTRGVDAVAAQAAAVQTADNQPQAQPQAQAQEKGKRVTKKEIEDYSEQEAFKIADARARRLALLVNPAQPGLWNVGPYLGVFSATLGQCSLKEGCSATTQDSLRKPSGWTAIGLELRVTPFAPFKIDIVQLVARVGADMLNGQIAGLSSGTALSYSGEARLVMLGIVGVGVGYAGQMTSWGVVGAGGGAEQRSAMQHYGQFSVGVTLRAVTLTGECRVGSWAGFNLDRADFGSVAGYCGTVLNAMIY